MNIMEYRGFKARIMEAERLVGNCTFGLPPGAPLSVYHVDEFVHPHESWIAGPGSFVVPVKPNKGLWFDWRLNSEINTAIIPSVKGCNPITGMKTDSFHLETYNKKCPKHGCDFKGDRYCPECDFKWPSRNYQSMSPLWWDGWFNSEDGTVRQFFFTEDELRDVAKHLIGKKNTVPAYGFAFFSPKEMRPEPQEISRGINFDFTFSNNVETGFYNSNSYEYYCLDDVKGDMKAPPQTNAFYMCSDSVSASVGSNSLLEGSHGIMPNPEKNLNIASLNKSVNSERQEKRIKKLIETYKGRRKLAKSVEVSIGAGAKIRQALNNDIYPVDSWKDVPDAVMTIYFVFHDEFEKIKSQGMRDLKGSKEGMLKGVPVG